MIYRFEIDQRTLSKKEKYLEGTVTRIGPRRYRILVNSENAAMRQVGNIFSAFWDFLFLFVFNTAMVNVKRKEELKAAVRTCAERAFRRYFG